MNIGKLKRKIAWISTGVAILLGWLIYFIAIDFSFYDFITSPVVWSLLLVLTIPISLLIAEKIKV